MKKVILILFIIVVVLVSLNEKENILIPDNAIRFRVIANSNSLEDQLLKLKVKEKVTKHLYKKLGNAKNIDEARHSIKNNLDDVDSIVSKTLNNNNYEINYGNNYFPNKKFRFFNFFRFDFF